MEVVGEFFMGLAHGAVASGADEQLDLGADGLCGGFPSGLLRGVARAFAGRSELEVAAPEHALKKGPQREIILL